MREREGPTPQAWEGEGFPLAQHYQNGFTHTVNIRQYFVVPEPQNPPASTFEPRYTPSVSPVVGMLAAIGLNDDKVFCTGEIDDKGVDRKLPPELVIAKPTIA